MPDSALLPDGRILFVNGAGWGLAGGNGGQADNAGDPVFETHVYDPSAPSGRRWSTWARSVVPRLYHSGIILLESGELVTMGSEMQNYIDIQGPNPRRECFPLGSQICTNPYEYRIEKFTPPYLLTGKYRPVIQTAPGRLTYGSVFSIQMPFNSPTVDKVSFIRYSTTTHSTNTDQRFVELEILRQTRDGKLYLRAPLRGSIAPPGNWMMFILKEGVPSVAKTILLQNGSPTYEVVPPEEEEIRPTSTTTTSQMTSQTETSPPSASPSVLVESSSSSYRLQESKKLSWMGSLALVFILQFLLF
jgi:hypothetical protein